MPKRLLATVTSILVLGGTAVLTPVGPTYAAGSTILGDYAAPISTSDGDLDVPATVGKLAAANVNTYAYLICQGATSGQRWNRLPDFLDAAAVKGVKVWVYLCPPSESGNNGQPDLLPYGWDYVAWATHIAELSTTHPNLTGYAIDDFASNTANPA